MEFEIKCLYPRRVNTELIPYLPLTSYKGETEVVDSDEKLDIALPEIARETLLGFDTETRPNFSRGKQYPVSILQLAGENKAWIIRLDPLAERLPEIFKVLESPSVKKVGLAVQGDIKSLRSRCHFVPAGFFDISTATQNIGVINTGMRNLTALIFGQRLSKAAQLTNWAAEELTKKQIEYAATDAWIGRRLFVEVKKVLEENRTEIEPEPEPEPQHFNLRFFVRGIISKIAKTIKRVKKPEKPKRKKQGVNLKKRSPSLAKKMPKSSAVDSTGKRPKTSTSGKSPKKDKPQKN